MLVVRAFEALREGCVKETDMTKKALKAKKTRTIDVKVLDAFEPHQPRIVVEVVGRKVRVLNSETGRATVVSIESLQQNAHRCSEKDTNAALRNVVRDMPKLALKWGLVQP